jgi:hypothetical protein
MGIRNKCQVKNHPKEKATTKHDQLQQLNLFPASHHAYLSGAASLREIQIPYVEIASTCVREPFHRSSLYCLSGAICERTQANDDLV